MVSEYIEYIERLRNSIGDKKYGWKVDLHRSMAPGLGDVWELNSPST